MARRWLIVPLLLIEVMGLVALQSMYVAMFSEFGVVLPVFTRVMLSPLVPICAALIALSLVAQRRAGAALVVGVLLGIAFLAAVVIVRLPMGMA